ncbi:hypothetical protein ACPZ19_42495 [Amycolatopsis lurida]
MPWPPGAGRSGPLSQLDLPTLADNGYDGAGIGVFTPVKQSADCRTLDPDTRTTTPGTAGLRCLGERGLAPLTGRRRALRHFTTSPARSVTSSKSHS